MTTETITTSNDIMQLSDAEIDSVGGGWGWPTDPFIEFLKLLTTWTTGPYL